MEIAKLTMAAIGLVMERTGEFQVTQGKVELKPKLSEKAQKIQEIFSSCSKTVKRVTDRSLKAFSVLLGEDLSLPKKKKKITIPTHVLVFFFEEDPDPGESDRELALGSIMLDGEDDDELFPKLVTERGKWYYRESNDIGFPTDDEISAFINGLPEKILRREFHYLVQ